MTLFLVTGSGKGIGYCFINEILESNPLNKVVGISRSLPPMSSTIEKASLDNRYLFLKADLTDTSDFMSFFQEAHSRFGVYPSRYLVNAGMRLRSRLESTKPTDLSAVWQTNYFQLRQIICCLVSLNITDSRVVYVSSVVSQRGFADLDDYGATKAAGEALIRSSAVRFPEGCYNSILPGFAETSYASQFQSNLPELYNWTLNRTPKGRWATASEVTALAHFLFSDAASYITGQSLVVDGGWLSNA